MSPRTYTSLLRTKPVGYLMATSIAARLTLGMGGLAITLMVTKSGSYALAGVVAAAYGVGAAVSGPVLGGLVDRYGRARVLRPTAVADGCLLIGFSVLPVRWHAALVTVGLLAGMAAPPVIAATRSLWPVIVAPESVQPLFALEATLQELPFIAGPALVAVVTAVASPRVAVAIAGAVVAVGVLAFSAHPATQVRPAPAARERRHRSLRLPVRLSVLVVAASFVGAFGVLELAVVRFARDHHSPAAAGVVLAVWSLGSLLGGLAWGARAGASRSPLRRLMLLALMLAGGLALPVFAMNLPVLALLLTAGGVTIAPAFGAVYAYVGASATAHRQTEAFGWLSTAFQVGGTAGAGVGGLLVQHLGVRPAFGCAAGGVLMSALLLVGSRDANQSADEPATSADTASQDLRAAMSTGSQTGANGGA